MEPPGHFQQNKLKMKIINLLAHEKQTKGKLMNFGYCVYYILFPHMHHFFNTLPGTVIYVFGQQQKTCT